MFNELIFILFIILDLFLALLVLKYAGKWGLILFYVLHVIMVQFTIQMQVDLFGTTVVIASMLFAALFLITDMLTEHYGSKEGYRAIFFGAFGLIFFIGIVQLSLAFLPSVSNTIYDAFVTLFGSQLRITLSDLFISYLIFQFYDVWVYHKIQLWTKGKMLWLRNIASTFTSQTLIAILFFQAAFAGVIAQPLLWQIIFGGLAMKLLIALLDTPFMYLSFKFLPRKDTIFLDKKDLFTK